jgi:hypothetical protein
MPGLGKFGEIDIPCRGYGIEGNEAFGGYTVEMNASLIYIILLRLGSVGELYTRLA